MRRNTALVLPPNHPNDVLVHGYTLHRLTRLAMFAVTTQIWHHRHDFAERVEAAWSAIAEYFYASSETPDLTEVLQVACGAITDHCGAAYRDCGHQGTAHTATVSVPGFDRYWLSADFKTQSDESEFVVEAVALSQIWPRMSTANREIFLALALYGDREEAARSLGKSPVSFATQIYQARREFMQWWHEGERPNHPHLRYPN